MPGYEPTRPPGLIWWEYVSGPSRFLRKAAEALCEGKHLCLDVPRSFPWRGSFFERLKDAVREFDNGLLFEEIIDFDGEPGELLVRHFNSESAYRPTKTYSEFFKQSKALDRCVVCVLAETEESVRGWMDFAKEFRPTAYHSGLVLLEAYGKPQGMTAKHIRVLSYDDYITEYDAQIFAELLIPDYTPTDDSLSIRQKKYITALAVSLFGTDAPGVADFVMGFRFDAELLDLLNSAVQLQDDELRQRVWNAQVQTLFPMIMQEGREFIDDWRGRIEDAFAYADKSLSGGIVDSKGDRISSPDEMEVATICYMMRTRRRRPDGEETGEYLLFIPDETSRARIELLYDMRNRIAHGKVCSPTDVKKLMNPLR